MLSRGRKSLFWIIVFVYQNKEMSSTIIWDFDQSKHMKRSFFLGFLSPGSTALKES